MTKHRPFKNLFLSIAISSVFVGGFSVVGRSEEGLGGPLPPRVSDIPRSVPHVRSARHDANGNFICGATQARHYGLRDPRFRLALNWARLLPHVSPAPDVVVVQRRKGHALGGGPGGHVSRIVRLINACRAIVTDEKGTYERNICANLVAYVRPE